MTCKKITKERRHGVGMGAQPQSARVRKFRKPQLPSKASRAFGSSPLGMQGSQGPATRSEEFHFLSTGAVYLLYLVVMSVLSSGSLSFRCHFLAMSLLARG